MPVNYYFTEEGITRGEEEEGIIPWGAIYRVDTTNLNIIIFIDNKLAFPIPKENLGEEYPEIRDFMLSKLTARQARMDNMNGRYVEEREDDN